MPATLIDLVQWLETLPATLEPTNTELQQVGESQVERIKVRTAAGISVDMSPFPPYSDKYAKQKSPDTPAALRGYTVSLRASGEMLDNIVVAGESGGIHLFFASKEAETKARYQNNGTTGAHAVPQRFFFGVSLHDREEIVGEIRQLVFKRVNK